MAIKYQLPEAIIGPDNKIFTANLNENGDKKSDSKTYSFTGDIKKISGTIKLGNSAAGLSSTQTVVIYLIVGNQDIEIFRETKTRPAGGSQTYTINKTFNVYKGVTGAKITFSATDNEHSRYWKIDFYEANIIDKAEISNIYYNTNSISKVLIGNNKIIWENWKYSTTTIKKEVYSSGGGWNTSFKWSSGWITLEKPIKNPTGKVTLSTRDTSGSNAKGYVRYSNGVEEHVGTVDGGYHGANESWGGNKSFALTNDKEIVAYKIDGEHAKFSGGTTVGIEFNTYYQKG